MAKGSANDAICRKKKLEKDKHNGDQMQAGLAEWKIAVIAVMRIAPCDCKGSLPHRPRECPCGPVEVINALVAVLTC